MIVTSPKAGDVWVGGQSPAIQWKTNNHLRRLGSTVTISVIPAPINCLDGNHCPDPAPPMIGQAFVISSTAPNLGSFKWDIPDQLPATQVGTGQVIISINGTSVSGKSQIFTLISNATPAPDPTPTPVPPPSNCNPDDLGCDTNPQTGDTFTLSRGQSHTVAGHPGLVVTYSDFIPVACTQNFVYDPNCFGIITVTVGSRKFDFQTTGESQTISPGVPLTLVSVRGSGLSATFTTGTIVPPDSSTKSSPPDTTSYTRPAILQDYCPGGKPALPWDPANVAYCKQYFP